MWLLISHFQVQASCLSFEWESISHGSIAFQREIKYGDKKAVKIIVAFARQSEASGYLGKNMRYFMELFNFLVYILLHALTNVKRVLGICGFAP